ncbi:MAG: LacI family DNA-binding transcriptional regulator [Gemmatimonadaceae bacterium]
MASIKDVAREAGVSVATVSRVCNDSGVVSDSTRKHVLEIASKLGYSAHGAARSLITSRTSTLGVLLPDLYGEFFSEVIRGIDRAVQGSGYHLLVSRSHGDENEIVAAFRAMRGRVDGLLIMSPDLDARNAVSGLRDHFPVVLLNCPAEQDQHDSIVIANYDGACEALRHFVERGHRRIAMITGLAHNYDADERLRAFRDVTRQAGIARDDALEVSGDFTEASGFRAGQTLLDASPRPTAVFAANDSMAIGALSAFRAGGARVPEDISVAGFDDIPMARYMNPPLTTVHVDISTLGVLAAERLLGHVRDGNGVTRQRELVPAHLVIRSSCGDPVA